MNSIKFATKSDLFHADCFLSEENTAFVASYSDLTISSDDMDEVVSLLKWAKLDNFEFVETDKEPDGFRTDAEADADALASAGMGTDEDYGYYGDGGDE